VATVEERESVGVNGSMNRRAGQDVRLPKPRRRLSIMREQGTAFAVTSDLVTVAIGLVVATGITSWSGKWSTGETWGYLALSLGSLPLWWLVFKRNHMYSDRVDTRLIDDLRRVAMSCLLGAMALILLSWPLQVPVSREWMAVLLLVLVPMLVVERHAFRVAARRRRREGVGLRPVAIMGTNAEALSLAKTLSDPALGCDVVVFLATTPDAPAELAGRPVLHSPSPAADAKAFGATGVAIAATALPGPASSNMLRSFLDRGLRIEMTSGLTDVAVDRISVHALGRHPMISLEPGHRGGWRAAAKRAFDVVVASVTLVLVSPVLAVAAIAVKLDSRGPVIFSQERVGRRAVPFKVHKIRSMVADAEEQLIDLRAANESDGPLFKMESDPRVTRVGRILRSTSIDELPQLWNVVRGDMSLVGPRPALPNEVEAWNDELRNRLRVRPGITGMWQVSGRSSTTFAEYQRLDLFYIDNWSILIDLAILAKTVPAVLAKRGAH